MSRPIVRTYLSVDDIEQAARSVIVLLRIR
jgi:hypothetical protein